MIRRIRHARACLRLGSTWHEAITAGLNMYLDV